MSRDINKHGGAVNALNHLIPGSDVTLHKHSGGVNALVRASWVRLKAGAMREDEFWNFLSRPFYPEAVAR